MDWKRISADWRVLKAEIKKRLGRLTDDDLAEIGGEREKLVARLEARYGISRAEAERRAQQIADALG